MAKSVVNCFITNGNQQINDNTRNSNSWKAVRVANNRLLQVIMDFHDIWPTSPIVKLFPSSNFGYKIIPIFEIPVAAIFYQICINLRTNEIMNKRKVIVVFSNKYLDI